MLYTFCVFFIFILCVVCEASDFNQKWVKILNIRRGDEGLRDGLLFFLMHFFGLGTHNLRKARKRKKIHTRRLGV